MKTLMQLHHHFQLTPGQLTSCHLGWIEVRMQKGNVWLQLCVHVYVNVCASSWPYNTPLLMQTQYA